MAQALIGNRRSLRIHVKRKIQGGLIIPRMKVAMGYGDAEKFVVVMKLL